MISVPFSMTTTLPGFPSLIGFMMSSAATRPATLLFGDSSRINASSMYSVVPQSPGFLPGWSRMMTSWETSTSRRVRYPESAVRSAVSARPLRAPCVEMKYSSTVRPSMKFALIGRAMIWPFGSAMRPRIPASWRIWLKDPRAPDWAIM